MPSSIIFYVFELMKGDVIRKNKKYVRGGYWKNGKLILFHDSTIEVMRPWGPAAGAWKKGKVWKCFRPTDRILQNPYNDVLHYNKHIPPSYILNQQQVESSTSLTYKIPIGISVKTAGWIKFYYRWLEQWKSIEQFKKSVPEWALVRSARLYERQWHMLQLFNRVEGAKDLFDSTPAVAFMLASGWAFHPVKRHLRSARSLVHKPQKEILGWLGFPQEKSVLKLLRKIETNTLTMQTCFGLRHLLKMEGSRKILNHIKIVNHDLTDFMLSGWNYDFINDIVHNQPWHNSAFFQDLKTLKYDIMNMDPLYNGNTSMEYLNKFTHFGQVVRYHDDLADKMNQQNQKDRQYYYQSPPFLPPENIVPITDSKLLFEEGRNMRNCVFSYHKNILAGKYYVYHMDAPEKCTIGLRMHKQQWVVDQVKLKRNEQPTKETILLALQSFKNATLREPSSPSHGLSSEELESSMVDFDVAEEVPF